VARFRNWLPQALLILVAGLWVFSPAFTGGWVWDDAFQITNNGVIHAPDGFWKVWVRTDPQGDYYPLTAFVRWIEWHLWGDDTLGYHLVNLGLHLASAFLIWRLFFRLGLPLAWLGALIFTIHPINVESVAWITELKNTLSLPPLLLAMLAWLDWKDEGRKRAYYSALAWFVISMLAKTAGLMLPFVLLGHAWWKYGRISRGDVKAVLPFLAIAVAASAVTLAPQHASAAALAYLPVWHPVRGLICVGWMVLFMLLRCLVPFHLQPIYDGFVDSPTGLVNVVPWLALGLFCAFLWCARRRTWWRHLLFGLGFFLVNLVPIAGFTFLKYTVMVWALDHDIYVSFIGLVALALAGLGALDSRLSPALRTAERIVVGAAIVVMAWSSHSYASWFSNSQILWTRTLQRDPSSWLAEQNLTSDALERGDFNAALEYAQRFLALQPDSADAHYDLGLAREKLGQGDAAGVEYREAIRRNPGKAEAYLHLGEAARHAGHPAQAEQFFRDGLKATPDSIELAMNLAGLLLKGGQAQEAMQLYDHAAHQNPDFAPLQYDYASALLAAGSLPEAEEHFARAVAMNPRFAAARQSHGAVLAQMNRLPEAISEFDAALEIDPTLDQARNNLARALVQSGHIPEAVEQLQKVLQYHPDDVQAQQNLTRLQQYEQQHPAGASSQ
jgi:tetratricopeptide (TPR) repeat protein